MAQRRKLGGRVITKKVIQIEGIAELSRRAQDLMRKTGYNGGDVAQELKKGLMIGALMLRDEIRDMAPVVTGKLKSAVFAAYGNRRKPDVLVGVNTTIAVGRMKDGSYRTYAGIVEYGDDYRAPHPFIRPAIAAMRGILGRITSDELRKAIAALAGK